MSFECFMKLFIVFSLLSFCKANLFLGLYKHSCPKAEKIVSDYVNGLVSNSPSLAPALLQLHFHDCFVSGCDASVLLNSTSTNRAEKDTPPNRTLRGFEVIDHIKSLIESECPNVVSCADILALAARDAVEAIGGPHWRVPTGRRDGLISMAPEAERELPDSSFDFTALKVAFANKGLNATELVYLSGAHTIGSAHCSSFANRIYNFTGYADQDPTLDPCYAINLKETKCTTSNDTTTIVEMDPGSARTFDLGYYKNVLNKKALFQSDAALLTDHYAKSLILSIVESPIGDFLLDFALTMEKLGNVMVKTGSQGEIRKNCAVLNS